MQRDLAIYFFGAGASVAETPVAPSSADLLHDGLVSHVGRYPELRRFLGAWGFREPEELPSLEELLSILDTCLVHGEPLGPCWSISELTRVREEVVSCIYELIGATLDTHHSDDRGIYQRFLRLVPRQGVSLITSNYDILLDESLVRTGLRPDYLFDFVAPPPPSEAPAIKLLKLHGSLNWGYCQACYATVHTEHARVARDHACPVCRGPLLPLIIPPTPVKNPPSPFLSSLWKKAEWELSRAREITFIGYSLSDADANIRYLLFRGFFGSAPQVKVVLKRDPHEELEAVVGRYRRLFPGGVEVYWEGFVEYVDELERQRA